MRYGEGAEAEARDISFDITHVELLYRSQETANYIGGLYTQVNWISSWKKNCTYSAHTWMAGCISSCHVMDRGNQNGWRGLGLAWGH